MKLNVPQCTALFPVSGFSTFNAVDSDSIALSMNSSTSTLDPFPTTILKHSVSVFDPHITAIVNAYLSDGIVPPALKMAAITLHCCQTIDNQSQIYHLWLKSLNVWW